MSESAKKSPELTIDYDPSTAGAWPGAVTPRQGAARERAAAVGWPEVPGYEIVGELGRGGMGVVFQAKQVGLNRQVALKMILSGPFAEPELLARFKAEAEAVAQLQHPNIVQIYDIGEHEGCPFFALEFVDGGPLDKHLRGTPQTPRVAAELVEILARAMQVAHDKGIVHRDLKPANILLSTKLEKAANDTLSTQHVALSTPKISDFGLAKKLDRDSSQTKSGQVMGTPSYMAPEQAAGNIKAVSAVSDVYALGAILYELLTGRPPFRGPSAVDTVMQVITCDPVAPRKLQPKTPRDLETITLKCLEKDPRRRYHSARALADDLRRFLDDEPIHARPVRSPERLWRWSKRHPALAGGMVTTGALLVAVAMAAISVAHARAARLEEEVLKSNVYAARGVASTVLLQLTSWSQPVIEAADDPEVRRLMKEEDRAGLTAYFDRLHRKYDDPARGLFRTKDGPVFQSWYVLNAKGVLLAVSPDSPRVVGKLFPGRDYFQGSKRHMDARGRSAIHISRLYKAESDELFKFSIATAVHADAAPESAFVGVVVASVTTTSTLGSLNLNDERRKAVLVGRRDTNSPRTETMTEQPPEYLVLLHPAYHRGDEALAVRSDAIERLPQQKPGDELQLPESASDIERAYDDDYRDPLGITHKEYRGRWLAGFAPVGNTECVVIVQQRYDETIEPDATLERNLALYGGLVLMLGLLLTVSVVWHNFRHKPRI